MDFQLTAIAAFLVTYFVMKASALVSTPNAGWSFLYRSPVFAPFSERRNRKKSQSSVKRLKNRFLIVASANIIAIELYQLLFHSFDFSVTIKGYLFAPFIYLFTNLAGVSAQCLGLLTKELPVDIHNHPYRAKNLGEFWARRWNVWVGDWLAVTSKKLAPRSRQSRLLLAFVLSGLFHEVIIATPYYLVKGESFFGHMTLFFLLQYLFVAIDKQVLAKAAPGVRRLFLWSALIAPMPLFNNPSVLAFFGF